MSFGILERYDCRAWADWAKGRFGSMPVYLFGISMGAAVLMSADILPFGSVRGIIADSGYASVHGILEHVIKNNLHLSYTIRKDIADRICKRKMNISLEDGCVKNSLENTEIPVLFIHGSDDKFVPVEMTYENYKNCKSLKRLLIIPGGRGTRQVILPIEKNMKMRSELSGKNLIKRRLLKVSLNFDFKKDDIFDLAGKITAHSYRIEKANINKLFKNINPLDYEIISILARESGKNETGKKFYLSDMSEQIGLPISRVSRIVRRLYDKKLVDWKHDGDGNEGTYICITDGGLTAARDQHERLEKFYIGVVEEFGRDRFLSHLHEMAELDGIMQKRLEDYPED